MIQPPRALSLLAAVTCALALSGLAQAQQKYPNKPIRFVVPFSPGGGTDTMARLIAQKMGENWGQSVLIENRTGAGGTIGITLVSKATPDGYTILVSSSAFSINAALQPSLPYDPLKDFVGVTQLGVSMSTLVVTPTLGVKTLKDFIEYAKARPGKVLFSSGGFGSSTHINAERFRLAAGFKPVHVAFKGSSDAALEVVAGRVQYMITGLLTVLPYVQDGRLVPLGVLAPTRSPIIPDVPTIAEVLPGYKRDGAHVMLAPAGTPRPIVHQLSKEVRRIFELPDVKERLKNYDYFLSPTTPEELDQILRADIATFSEVVKLAGLRTK
jgi:tripartite-type tricarboxylate transporter receptor subunit TctC